jgi:hypothetical protein
VQIIDFALVADSVCAAISGLIIGLVSLYELPSGAAVPLAVHTLSTAEAELADALGAGLRTGGEDEALMPCPNCMTRLAPQKCTTAAQTVILALSRQYTAQYQHHCEGAV